MRDRRGGKLVLAVEWSGSEADCRSRGNANANEVKPGLLHGIWVPQINTNTHREQEA